NILHMTAVGAIDIVSEWDKGIRAETDTVVLRNPCRALQTCQRLRRGGEARQHRRLFRLRQLLSHEVLVNQIELIDALRATLKTGFQHTRMLLQKPFISFIAGEPGAVNA